MQLFRIFTLLAASTIIINELYRLYYKMIHVPDGVVTIAGLLFLVVGTLLFTQDTPRRRAFFASGWGI